MVNPRQTSQSGPFASAGDELRAWLAQGQDLLDRWSAAQGRAPAANQPAPLELEKSLASAQRELASTKVELESLEIAHFDLACRNMGALRLHACAQLGEVINTLVEITLNFLGFGSFALYLSCEQEPDLVRVAGEGLGPDSGLEPDLRPETIQSLCDDTSGRAGLLVPIEGEAGVVRLLGEGRLVGALRLIHTFPQKRELSDADLEYLSILSEHGGLALRRAWIVSTCERSWWSRSALKALLNS